MSLNLFSILYFNFIFAHNIRPMSSQAIQIKQATPTAKIPIIQYQCGLTQQLFDPSFSSSPPNLFISTLKKRISAYDFFINEAIRKSE